MFYRSDRKGSLTRGSGGGRPPTLFGLRRTCGCGDELGNEAKSGFVVFFDEASDS
jgi:hypothetical protein